MYDYIHRERSDMPRITVKIPSSYESITHQVAHVVARDVMKVTDINYDATKLHVLGEFQQVAQPGTSIGSNPDVTFGGNSRVVVTIDDSLRNDSILNQYVRSNEHHPILMDTKLGIGLFPVYVDSDLTLSFKYIAASRGEAIKWRDEFAIRRAEDRTALYHEIFYYVPIQDSVLEMLAHFWELREKVSGTGDTYAEYIDRIQQRQLTTLQAIDKDVGKSVVAIPEKQVQITGYFDFSDIPKENKTDGTTVWEIEWSYKLLYKRCTHFYLTYPISIHQQHISKKYYSDRKIYNLEELPKMAGIAVRALDAMDGYVGHFDPLAGGVRYPHYDDWTPNHFAQPLYTTPQITWLMSLKSDTTVLADLNNIPDMRFTEVIEGFMRAEAKHLTKRGDNLIHITLFCNGRPLEDGIITVDGDLKINITRKLDLSLSYRLRYSLVTDRRILSNIGKDSAKRSPEALIQIVKTLIPSFDTGLITENLLGGKYVPDFILDYIFDTIEKQYRHDEERGLAIDGIIPPKDGGEIDNRKQGYWSNTLRRKPKYVQMLAIATKR